MWCRAGSVIRYELIIVIPVIFLGTCQLGFWVRTPPVAKMEHWLSVGAMTRIAKTREPDRREAAGRMDGWCTEHGTVDPHTDPRGAQQATRTAGRENSGILLLRASPKIPNTVSRP